MTGAQLVDRCPTCGQRLPKAGHLTPRELELLARWWMVGSVKQAARDIGMGQQRAKNLLHTARIRNQAKDNDQLLAQHFAQVRLFVSKSMSHKRDAEEAA